MSCNCDIRSFGVTRAVGGESKEFIYLVKNISCLFYYAGYISLGLSPDLLSNCFYCCGSVWSFTPPYAGRWIPTMYMYSIKNIRMISGKETV